MLRIIKTLTFVALSLTAINASAQDLLASRAPSDRKLTDIKNIKINSTPAFVDLHNPASNIYSKWDHASALIAPGTLPANFKVDLRAFAMPTPSRKVTSPFGARWGRQHKGLDVKVYIGDTICAAFDGKVRITKYDANGWGYYVVIRHPNGLETLYGHLSKQLVKEDQIVRAGEPIGLGGNTGRSTGSHLHFETRLLGQAINPALMFDFEAQDVTGDFYVVKNGTIQNSKPANSNSAVASSLTENQKSAQQTTTTQKAPAVATAQTNRSTQTPHQTPSQQSTASTGGQTYIVKDGDNLFRIAQNHGLTIDQLCKLNGIKANTTIKKGQSLRVS